MAATRVSAAARSGGSPTEWRNNWVLTMPGLTQVTSSRVWWQRSASSTASTSLANCVDAARRNPCLACLISEERLIKALGRTRWQELRDDLYTIRDLFGASH